MWIFLKESFKAIGEFQSRLILTLIYIFVVPVFALMAFLRGDALGLGQYRSQSQSYWRKRQGADLDLEAAGRQS